MWLVNHGPATNEIHAWGALRQKTLVWPAGGWTEEKWGRGVPGRDPAYRVRMGLGRQPGLGAPSPYGTARACTSPLAANFWGNLPALPQNSWVTRRMGRRALDSLATQRGGV